MEASSLCFLQALARANSPEAAITEQEYHQHVLSHLRGVRHPDDNIPSVGETLCTLDPWAASLRELSLKTEYEPLKDTLTYSTLFAACLSDDLHSFSTALRILRSQRVPNPSQSAACLAAQKQRPQLLRHCLDQGAVFDKYLNRAGQMGAQTPEMMDILIDANWSRVRQSREAVEQQLNHFGDGSWQALHLREHVANLPSIDSPPELRASGKGKVEDAEGETQSSGRAGAKGKAGTGKPTKASNGRSQRQGLSPEQIEEWFGDVPW